MKSIFFVLLLVSSIVFLTAYNQEIDLPLKSKSQEFGWKAVYKHDDNGKPVSGSLDSLIAGIRNGYQVRVGWGWERKLGDSTVRLEHIAEPLFLTIIQEKNVSVVIDAHPLLKSYLDIQQQKFGEGGHFWQCVLTTQGSFNAQVHNRSTGELVKDWPQKHRMTWFLEYPSHHRLPAKKLFE
jgi:hypothetical protein